MIIDAPLTDKTNHSNSNDGGTAIKPGTTPQPSDSTATPEGPMTTQAAQTPTPGAPALKPTDI